MTKYRFALEVTNNKNMHFCLKLNLNPNVGPNSCIANIVRRSSYAVTEAKNQNKSENMSVKVEKIPRSISQFPV